MKEAKRKGAGEEISRHELREQGWKNSVKLWIAVMLLLSLLLYARRLDYNLFILNKAVAGSAVFLIGTSFLIGPLARLWPKTWVPRLYLRKYFGVFGFGVAMLHMILSLLMFSPAYYPKMFTEAGKLTGSGEISMLFAALSLLVFAAVSVTSIPSVEEKMRRDQWLLVQRLGYVAFLFTLIHIVVIKWQGWFAASNWLNGLPPASLLPFLYILVVFAFRVGVMFIAPQPPATTAAKQRR